jgi:hypothetical protein
VDDRRPVPKLRLVAARFINSDVGIGLAELDRITAAVSRIIQKRYRLLSIAFYITAVVTLLLTGASFALSLNHIPGADALSIASLLSFGLLVAVLLLPRVIQYGGIRATVPQVPIYSDPDEPAVRNLELLFTLLQLESSPRAFFVRRDGSRRYVDERYFFGSLRAGHVAKDNTIRNALFGPVGLWFSRELFLDADVEELIAQAKAKPSRAGAPKKYDYTKAIISLIDHPEVRAMDITKKRGNQTIIIGLLQSWYLDRDQKEPGETQLASYANQILEAIAKNRAS